MELLKNLKKEDAKIRIENEGPAYALINGDGIVGQLVGNFSMNLAIKKASSSGIAIVGMHNMHSYSMPGYYSKMTADNNMIGIVVNNSKSRVMPFGGIDPKLGTNPIGLSIPSGKIEYNLDMATSIRAMGEVRLAKRLGKEIPEGMAVDKKGSPTNNLIK